jgi:molybdate transport system substrate-binding protein
MRSIGVATVVGGVLVAALFAGCSSGAGASPSPSASASAAPASAAPASPSANASVAPSAAPASLTVYGAASLKGVLDQVRTAYEAARPATTLTISTDSSSALETQIEQGAPADVFLSADTTNARKLVDGGFASGEPVSFAGNELTVIVPKGNPAGLTGPLDLAKAGVKVIAAGDRVPITKYAEQLVDNLAGSAGAPAGFAAKYAENIVSKEDNVKAVVGKIELGEGDAGIVYVTDAAASTKVDTIDVPADENVPATYAGVVVNASPHQEAARAFLDWFAGAEGQAILEQFGFLPAP